MALAALTTLPLRWRVAPDEPAAKWRSDSTAWAGQTVGDVRAALAPLRDSTATLAAAYAPELWLCDADGTFSQPEPPVDAEDLLAWTNSTYGDARLGERHASRKPKAFVLFTFPPAVAPTTTGLILASLTHARTHARARPRRCLCNMTTCGFNHPYLVLPRPCGAAPRNASAKRGHAAAKRGHAAAKRGHAAGS